MEAKLFKAKKADRTIVLECNGRDCTNSMMRCGTGAVYSVRKWFFTRSPSRMKTGPRPSSLAQRRLERDGVRLNRLRIPKSDRF